MSSNPHKPLPSTEGQREQMRNCLHSHCDAAADKTPIFLCALLKHAKRLTCWLFHEEYCEDYEKFPERFDT